MSTTAQQSQKNAVPALAGPRLPYHPAVEERFGIDKAAWKALCEAIFPGAQSTESVILALSYCKARRLDPFKRNVHIVPIWDQKQRRMVDTVWPGIGELRTTATRTGTYAGLEKTEFGPMKTREFRPAQGEPFVVEFPDWAQVTVKRMVQGREVSFEGPMVFWEETFSSNRDGCPNSMWRNRPRGQIAKCAEAAALRAAFPEELGDAWASDEAGGWVQANSGIPAGGIINHHAAGKSARAQLDAFAPPPSGEIEHQQVADPVQDGLASTGDADHAMADATADTAPEEGEPLPPHDPETGEVVEAPPPQGDTPRVPPPADGGWKGAYQDLSAAVDRCESADALDSLLEHNADTLRGIGENLATWSKTLRKKIETRRKDLSNAVRQG